MTLWTGVLLGVLGGLHCAGMCGPLMLAIPQGSVGSAAFALSRLLYQAGRILTYSVLGAVSGLLGRTLLLAGIQRWLSIGLGLALLVGLFVSPNFLALPWIAGRIGSLKSLMAVFLRKRSWLALAALGVLNGFLPCGLVYAACAGAAASGDWSSGAAFMAAFGAGTLPITLGISLSGQILPPGLRLRLRHALPIGIALMGCLLILRGLSLGIPYLSPDLSGGGAICCPPATP